MTAVRLFLLLFLCGACTPSDEHEHEGHEHSNEHDEHDERDATEGGHGHDEHEDGENAHDHSAHAEGEDSEVHLSPLAIQASGIEVGHVTRRALDGGAGFPSEVRFDPSSVAHVSPLVAGRFTDVRVRLGQHVEAGELLASMASAGASEAGASRARARARLGAAESTLARQQQLAQEGIGAQRNVIDARAEVAALQAQTRGLSRQLRVLGSSRGGGLRLRAPIRGVVVALHATPGESVLAGQRVFTIADPDAISVYAQVPESRARDVSEGAAVVFRPYALEGTVLDGIVQYIAPSIDSVTRSLSVRVNLETADPDLRSGMFGVTELTEDVRRVLAVPVESMVVFKGIPSVFVPVPGEEGTFTPHAVDIGRRAGSFYALVAGLHEGDALVESGAFVLKSAMSTEGLAEHEH